MTTEDEHGGGRDDAVGPGTLADVLDEFAAAEGLSREAMFEHLISSYWRLEEVSDLLGETDSAGASSPRGANDSRGAGSPETDANARLEADVAGLTQRVERLESAFDEPDSVDRGTDLVDRLSGLETAVSQLDDQLTSLRRTAVSEEMFTAVNDQTRSFQGAHTARHESLRDRVGTEFDHLRTILEYLIETMAANEGRIERVTTEFEAPIRTLLAERETLDGITRTAIRRGVSTASCEHCGQSVDLSMLVSPRCPGCEHRFLTLEQHPGFLGLWQSPVLTAEPA